MTWEHVKGARDNAVGVTKEFLGQIFGASQLVAEGKMDQVRGDAHIAAGKAKEAAREATCRYLRYTGN